MKGLGILCQWGISVTAQLTPCKMGLKYKYLNTCPHQHAGSDVFLGGIGKGFLRLSLLTVLNTLSCLE